MENNLKRWISKEIITQSQADKILSEYNEESKKIKHKRVKIILYILSMIFLGLGIVLFVAANDWLLKLFNMFYLSKILILTLITFASLYFGYKLKYEQNKEKLGGALIFLSSILAGADYALIGQIYHSEANTSSLFFLWLISILPLAYIFKAKSINTLSIFLFFIASAFFMFEQGEISYYQGNSEVIIIIPFITSIILYGIANIPLVKKLYTEFSLSYKFFSLLSFLFTLYSLILINPKFKEIAYIGTYTFGMGFFIVIATLLNLANILLEKSKTKLFLIEEGTIFALLFTILFLQSFLLSRAVIMILYFIIIILMFYFSYERENIKLANTSILFLILFVIYRFFDYSWSFLSKSIFFILMGAITLLYIYFSDKYLQFFKNKVLKNENNNK